MRQSPVCQQRGSASGHVSEVHVDTNGDRNSLRVVQMKTIWGP